MRRLQIALLLVLGGMLASPAPFRAEPHPADPALIDAIPAGPSAQERIEEIRRRVQAALVYPPAARRRGISGTTRIQFEIGAHGEAMAVETVESSGSRLLDRAAEQSARDAAPLPYVFGRLRIPVVFELHH